MIQKKDFWLYNISLLWKNYGLPFFPNNKMNPVEKLNAIVRFSLIFSLILILIGGDHKWLSLSLIIILLSILLFYKLKEYDSKIKCKKSTINNPFMNFLIADYYTDNKNLSACNEPMKNIKNNYQYNIYQNITDLYDADLSSRNFYTLPNTKCLNDQKKFAKWLYSKSGECKADGKQCDNNLNNLLTSYRFYR